MAGLGSPYFDQGLFNTGDLPGLISPFDPKDSSATLSMCRWNIFAVFTVIVDKEGFTVSTKNHHLAPFGTPELLGNEGVVVADPGIQLVKKLLYDVHMYAYDSGTSGGEAKEIHETLKTMKDVGTEASRSSVRSSGSRKRPRCSGT